MLKNLSIKLKLISSFSVIVVLLVLLSGYTNFGISKIGKGFLEYREMTRDSALASRVQSHVLEIRMFATKYFNQASQTFVDSFNNEYKDTSELLDVALKEIKNPTRAPKVQEMHDEVEKYNKGFHEVVAFMNQRNDILENILVKNGQEVEQLLTSVMLGAEKDGNMRASLDTAHGVRFLLLARLYVVKFLESNNKEDALRANKEFANLQNELEDIKQALKSPARKTQLEDAIGHINTYTKGLNDIVSIIEQRNSVIAMLDTVGPRVAKLGEEVETSIANDQDRIGAMVHSMDSTIFTLSLILSGVVLLVAILSAIMIPKEISTQLDSFKDGLLGFFAFLNRESDHCNRLDDDSNNEIGTMAKVVNKNIDKTQKGIEEDRAFIDDTVKVLSEFEQGDLCQRIHKDVQNPALQDLKKVLNSMGEHMEHNIEEILNIMEEYSNYNYLNQVDCSNVKNHLLHLSEGVNTLGASITTMLTESKRIGLTLDSSSDSLLHNVEVLNTATNEAAASLEETAAALEEITGTIISNTENVVEMANFANKVIQSVDEGNTLATQTSSSMDDINEQVTAINEAISVIDQIAFQTNILSLNAAVEAATAGEAGKGFAVVAQEVRNLAARSAEAAKEIKELVENATEKAGHGKTIADKMIHGYTDLNENIHKTIELINHVESASKEQKAGIEQINDAVTSQDQQTQQIAHAANETYDIAIHTSHISKKIVNNVDEKEFKGKNEIVDRRAKHFDLEYDDDKCRREGEKVIKAVKEERQESPKKKSTAPAPKKEPVKPAKKPEVIQPSKQSNDDEWESF